MFFRCFLVIIFLYIPVIGVSKTCKNKVTDKKRYTVEDEIILNYKAGTDHGRLESIAKGANSEIVYRSKFADFLTVRLDRKSDIQQTIKEFESFPEIVFAEPNGIAHLFWEPNDTYYYLQWNFDGNHLNMSLAWDIERGGNSSVIVSILDTGIAYKTNLIPDYEKDEVSSQDGYYHISPDLTMTNFVDGYDFISGDTLPNDEHGHGTHVCGTIAQSTNNYKGVAGMAFNVSIMPVRILDETGTGSCDVIADGIYYAYQNGADVLSMSLGGDPGDSTGFGTVHQAIIAATNAGAVVVAAAGNQDTSMLSYPAGFEECIAVGATDYNNALAPYSQWGDGIDVVAPGGDLNEAIPGIDSLPAGILQSTYYTLNDGYHEATVDSFCYMFLQGTSMAAPHVSALAALLISHGTSGVSLIKQTIYSTATDLGSSGYDTYFGYGLINPPLCLGAENLFASMPIIQNPYSQQYIDIWVVPKSPLMNDTPDTCRVTLAGVNTYLNFEKIDEQTYKTDFSFNTSGTATIYVTARDTSGTKGTITRNFSVSEIDGSMGGFADSEDRQFRITIPEDIYNTNTYWIVISSEVDELLTSSCSAISNVYQCGPEGKSINVPSVLRFSYNKSILEDNNPCDIGIYRKNGNAIEYIDTRIDVLGGCAYAKIKEFGSYILILWPGRGESSEISPRRLSVKCYPVPAKREFFFSYDVPFASSVDIALYDVSGRRVKTINNGSIRDYGMYTGSCRFGNGELPTGIYFLKIVLENDIMRLEDSKKVILMR